MTSRNVQTIEQRDMLAKFIAGKKPPFNCTISEGRKRSLDQNNLQRKWMTEIAEQRGDESAEYYRGYCKLRFGVPIMRRDDDTFHEKYDRIIKDMPYEVKIELMMEPMDLPVTRMMNVKQKSEYLDAIHRHFAEQGVILTQPESDT